MKDLSFFFLKNVFGAKMKKGIGTFCSGDGSTSTLEQGPVGLRDEFPEMGAEVEASPTLEEMIIQLELEEEIARAQKEEQYRRRMSSVNSSDILRSARSALNQYPRFSLDGRDAMYRSSFMNSGRPAEVIRPGRRSVCGPVDYEYNNHYLRTRFCDVQVPEKETYPRGESVVWCKPGVVAKLMGLEAIPIPVSRNRTRLGKEDSNPKSLIRRRRRAERHELERKIAMNNLNNYYGRNKKEGNNPGSCPRNSVCVIRPVAGEPIQGAYGTTWARKHYI